MVNQMIKDRAIVDDLCTYLDMDTEVPEQGDIIVPFLRWQSQQTTFAEHPGRVGVAVNGRDCDIYQQGAELSQQPLIALEFPVFTDGRCYSFARLLRTRFGFDGELRAIGNVLRDQLFYMHRCGINAFQLDQGRDLHGALTAFNDFSVSYQPI